jgi:predicted Zn-dependent protease
MTAKASLAAPARYALGMEAWARGRTAEARRQWLAAYKLDPDIPLLANNLASCLIATAPEDPASALTLVDRALGQVPGDPRLHLTRGQVLCKLGRWADAAAALEKAQEAGDKGDDLHKSLAEAYERLGRSDEAAEHRAALRPNAAGRTNRRARPPL